MTTQEEIIAFWFDSAEHDPQKLKARQAFWYGADEKVDADIRERFGDAHRQAAAGGLQEWASDARGRLALIIVLDQFSRNLLRGSAGAFAQDEAAQKLCLQGMQLGHDITLHPVHRSFYYMPLEHAEDPDLQHRSVASFRQLLSDAEPGFENYFDSALHWAEEHAAVVQRFGRFPHRNQVLNRVNSEAEQSYLEEGASSYGQ